MIFKSEPNMLVRPARKTGPFKRIKPFRFDANGLYETDNVHLIKMMARRFESVDVVVSTKKEEKTVKEPKTEVKMRKCKKCDFECETQGELLKHYRTDHKEEK